MNYNINFQRIILAIKQAYIPTLIVLLSSCTIFNINTIPNKQPKKWKDIPTFQNFVSPWDEKPFGKTTFQYQNDTEWFYFLFDVVDDDIQLCDTSLNNELNVLQSDRVELFFAKDSLMQPYYTFEMDAAGRLFDARCYILPKNKAKPKNLKQINANWDIDEADLLVKATKTKLGYQVKGKVAMSFLNNNHLVTNNQIWCGILRADFNSNSTTQWISAKNPKTKKPDFHCWGVFVPLPISSNN